MIWVATFTVLIAALLHFADGDEADDDSVPL
jgi:hypothetical protein